jgi:hypothetical protein
MKADRRAGAETFWLDMGAPIRIGDLADGCQRRGGGGWAGVLIEWGCGRERTAEELTSQGSTRAPPIHGFVARQSRPCIPARGANAGASRRRRRSATASRYRECRA